MEVLVLPAPLSSEGCSQLPSIASQASAQQAWSEEVHLLPLARSPGPRWISHNNNNSSSNVSLFASPHSVSDTGISTAHVLTHLIFTATI